MPRYARLLLLSWLAFPVAAEPAPFVDRVVILRTEMERGPMWKLERFLEEGANPESRKLAIRALGRIGDRGDAPAILAKLIRAGGPDQLDVLWAAGIAQSKSLANPLTEKLADKDPRVVAAAAEALGWTGEKGVAEELSPLLMHPDARVRAGALTGLARTRAEGYLERCVEFLHAPELEVREAADFACWRLAVARRRAALARNPKWKGDPVLARRFFPLLKAADPIRRMAGLRALGSLADQPYPEIVAMVADPDPRVVQDAIWRVLSRVEGDAAQRALTAALNHEDPKVRRLAIEALGKVKNDQTRKVLTERFVKEQDPRLKDVLCVEMARGGNETAWRNWSKDPRRAEEIEEIARLSTKARVLLASPRKEAVDDLLAWAQPKQAAALPPPVWMEILSGLEGRDDPRILVWLAVGFAGFASNETPGPYVHSSAISLIGKNRYFSFVEILTRTQSPATEVRRAVATACGELGAAADCPKSARKSCEKWVRSAWANDPSAFVRQAAREAGKKMKLKGVPEADESQPNDWARLPRPKRTTVLGLDLSGPGEWLTESEIVKLADKIAERKPTLEFTTTQGKFLVEVDPRAAPVHAASLVLSVHSGLYDGTRWHRVVPNFVIQGGDPHGHGAGDGGWTIPDEITRLRYVRGALGMPKSVKDDGGCQLFFMHTPYRPLDERYTCYGRVVAGMETVDKIRVGDRILEARILE